MARVRWHGTEFRADPIRQLPNGNWLMEAREHGPRFSIGTEIEVRQGEIVEMAAAEMPASPDAGLKELEAGMAKERETLPPLAQPSKDSANGPQA